MKFLFSNSNMYWSSMCCVKSCFSEMLETRFVFLFTVCSFHCFIPVKKKSPPAPSSQRATLQGTPNPFAPAQSNSRAPHQPASFPTPNPLWSQVWLCSSPPLLVQLPEALALVFARLKPTHALVLSSHLPWPPQLPNHSALCSHGAQVSPSRHLYLSL